MKIIIASGIYPSDIGGPATYSQLIAREFSKRRIDTKVICYSDEGDDDVTRILRKHNILLRYFLYFWNLLKLSRDSDIIYAQGPLAAGLPAMLVSKILRKKFVIKIVGDYAWEQFQNKKLKIKNKKFIDIETFQNKKYDFWTELRRRIQKIVVNKAKKIIVPSEFLKKIVKGWGIGEDKIEVIYNAFDRSRLTQIHAEIYQRKSAYPEGQNQRISADDIIISAGRPEPWKGFGALKEIMPDLLKENSKFKLVIATKFPHDELMGYFKASKIFVLNSGYEGFSHIILEAMACGLPVIVSNVCGNPEIVRDGYNGLLVEYNNKEQLKDAILKLWRNEELRKKFIENSYKTLKKFNLEDMINKTLEILKL